MTKNKYPVYVKKIAINQEEFEEFLLTLPECVRNEHFKWLDVVYDVARALLIITKLNIEARPLDVKDWCKNFYMDGPKDMSGTRFHWLTGITDAEVYRPEIDVKVPVIVVIHSYKNKKGKVEHGGILIDGNKRLRRAFLDGLETIPAFLIPKEYAKLALARR